MPRTISRKLVAVVALFCAGVVIAQTNHADRWSRIASSGADWRDASARDVIFSNLDRRSDDRFNPDGGALIAGKQTIYDEIETAVRFIPKVNANAKVLSAAVGYLSGTKEIILGIYSDNGLGTVGEPLPGGQGNTSEIPDAGECCELPTVVLPGAGVALTAGTPYWLVVSADNVNAPSFAGLWRLSTLATNALLSPPASWKIYDGSWVAAEIRGTNLDKSLQRTKEALPSPELDLLGGNQRIFANLDPNSTQAYDQFNGLTVRGNSVPFETEAWLAVPFTARVDSHAKTLAAAIGYVSGTKKVNLGIYNDDAGSVGTVLPNGQGSTTEIPDDQVCCDLARVTLRGTGAALTAGTKYWLVASPDDTAAPDFQGTWHFSMLAVDAYTEPAFFINWTSFSGEWLGAIVRGTIP